MKKLYFFLMAMMVSVVANAATVYFENSGNWAEVCFYCWGGSDASSKWPGSKVTTTVQKDGKTYYKVTTQCPSGIFNNNDKGSQTPDLQIIDNMIYNANGSTGKSFEGGTIEVKKNFSLAGNFNSYNGNDSKYAFTAEGNDIYTLHLDSFSAVNDFAVVENGAVWYKYPSAKLESGKEYVMSTTGTDNTKLATAAEDVTFKFNASKNSIIVTYTEPGVVVPVAVSYELRGNFAGDWADFKLTEENGKWVIKDLEAKKAADFGIKKLEDGVQAEWWWSADSATISEAGTYTVCPEAEGGKNFSIAAGTWSFSLDTATMKLTVTGEGGEIIPGAFTYAIHGNFEGTWASTDMTLKDGLWVVENLPVTNNGANFGVKEMENGSQVGWYSNGEVNITESGDYSLNGSGDASIAEGTWTLTFNPETKALKAVKEGDGPVVDYSTWYVNVFGEFNNWADNGVNPNEEGTAVVSDLQLMKPGTNGTGFKVKIWNGEKDIYLSNGQALTVGTSYVVKDDWQANMTVAGGTETDTYSVSFNVKTFELIVTQTTGVAEVVVEEGEAVYFTLQGVKVANPENGIYVKVVNGKASKVVVK